MNNALVLGLGIVGKSLADSLGIKHYHDLKKVDGYTYVDLKDVGDYRYIFVCLPSSVDSSGRYQLDTTTELIKSISSQGKQNVFIIKSTVYPGYADYVMDTLGINNVVSNPEFITEKTVEHDSMHPDIIVIGGRQPNYVQDVDGIYKARFKGADIIKTDNVTAETIKLAINGFYTTKVIYANQIYDYAKKTGAKYDVVKEAMYKRKWIGKNHLDVIHQGGRGAGGHCLKKDFKALATYSASKLFEKINIINEELLSGGNK